MYLPGSLAGYKIPGCRPSLLPMWKASLHRPPQCCSDKADGMLVANPLYMTYFSLSGSFQYLLLIPGILSYVIMCIDMGLCFAEHLVALSA